MITSRQANARLQSDFYRDHYYKLLRSILLFMVIILCLTLTIIYFVVFTVPPQYYGTATSGQIIKMTPL
jgi:hypothetical protein